YGDVFSAAERAGYPWAVADGVRVATAQPPRLAKTKEHDIDIIINEKLRSNQLTLDEVREALRWGQGAIKIKRGKKLIPLSSGGACPKCGFSVGELDPRFFSFNTRQGQCSRCEGTGLEPQPKKKGRSTQAPPSRPCKACNGERLSPLARKVQLKGWTYPRLTQLSVREVRDLLPKMNFSGKAEIIFEPILRELSRRLRFLGEVGLDYLSLDRDAATLSGGEIQRLRLAAQLGAGLTGALYVLDEPTIGLHPRDTARLLDNLRALVKTGSTVLMVEHDEDAIRAADHLIDMGPGGGPRGGQLIASGPPQKVLRKKGSPTAKALAQERYQRALLPVSTKSAMVELWGAREHNLKNLDLAIPRGRLTTVVGVSGSGKSTLIRQVFLPALQKELERVHDKLGAYDSIENWGEIKRAIAVDQSPIGRSPRSCPATFLGIFDLIRKLFASLPEAQVKGFSPARFSFNTPKGGRCTECDGQGVIAHEMSFLPDVVTTCPVCAGARYEERTLEVKYKGLSIGDVLQLAAEDAIEVFAAHPKICAPLRVLCDLGAGYLSLGQGSHTLSGGEAQRLKLATELTAGSRHEPTLYVLDEPTTGLHLADVDKLVGVLERLVDRGDTVVVIEHHPDVMLSSDWLIELGPEGGPGGGEIVFAGTPAALSKKKTPTGQVLQAAARR
ncbi:MAG: excinuclease ABC subunit A, partial [Polyangiaceae bacterium]|nr:excinuclease ABC subunit A [Polyangiaceae bacterium]